MAPSGGTGATTIAILGQRDAQSYNPNPVQAGGRSVVWRNDDTTGEVHNISATDGSWQTGDISPGATSPAIAMPAGGSTYFCRNHPDTMRGGAVQGSGGETPGCTGQYC